MQQLVGNKRTSQMLYSLVQAKQSRTSQPVAQRMKIVESGEEVGLDDSRVYELTAAAWLQAINTGQVRASEYEINVLRQLHEASQLDTDSDSDMEEELNPDQRELLDQMRPVFESQVRKRQGKKLPGKKVQGDLLEHHTSVFSNDLDVQEMNANSYAMNIPGIDHLQDKSSHLFVQDKMHLSQHTAKIETYRAHYKNRGQMAEKLVIAMAKNGKRGTNIRQLFQDAIDNESWVHKAALEKILGVINGYRDDDEISEVKYDDELIELVANNIAFTVPSDIWEAIYEQYTLGRVSASEMSAYIRLDMNTAEFVKVFELLKHVAAPWSEKSTKWEDKDYKP
ncbi:hypothetical protein CIG75_01070 [Tumebacillus algifaecis]|uniref:Uncharacterized protein n=2 Tax=Tumebacillus algifaecis TaxID=1214604 RepID=A0A223CX13_9BACL|nr:hypothetical protein CIG75_01070 [Tumebacillus algifaecis]